VARRDDLYAIEGDVPWADPAFRAGLLKLSDSRAAASRAFAADLTTIHTLLAQIPRCAADTYGGTPYTSFEQEVAVALQCSSRAAAGMVRLAKRMCEVLVNALDLLERGFMSPATARTLAAELDQVPDELAAEIDLELSESLIELPVWRVRQQVRKAVLAADADAAAIARAAAASARKVILTPLSDGMASVEVFGPALPTATWFATLTARAKALKAAGDPRTLQALRYDLTVATFGCATHVPPDPTAENDAAEPPDAPAAEPDANADADAADDADADTAEGDAATTVRWFASEPDVGPLPGPGADGPAEQAADILAAEILATDRARAAAGHRASGLPAAPADCRQLRPIQAMIVVPVETALGLSNEPAFLPGYGFLDGPSSRQLLVDAELRQVCARRNGQVIDVNARAFRPPPNPAAVRNELLRMVEQPVDVSRTTTDAVDGHDPTALMRLLVELRDRYEDGPTGRQVPATDGDLDHDTPWPAGPTAAWNLLARSRRAHALKHYGWVPERTVTHTVWRSPAGQVSRMPHWRTPPPGVDVETGADGWSGLPTHAVLPDPELLHQLDVLLATPPDPSDLPPGHHVDDTPDAPPGRRRDDPDDLPF